MYRRERSRLGPVRILDQSTRGGLGPGNLGLVMSLAGVGKTACLVHLALDDLRQQRPVLHIALDQTLDHVQSWYDALHDDTDDTPHATAVASATREVPRRLPLIASFTDQELSPERLEDTVANLAGFQPATILIDGYPWTRYSAADNAAALAAFKAHARSLGAELWMSGSTHLERRDGGHQLPGPYDAYAHLIDVAIYLDPREDLVDVRLLKDHDAATPPPTRLTLHPDTLRLHADTNGDAGGDAGPAEIPTSAYTMLSGGARGAEAAFGACAETWGLAEIHVSFAGRDPERKRGLVNLTDAELSQGAVSSVYVQARMNRRFPSTPLFAKMLQTIWHQVCTAGEVFAVGTVQGDGTVRGGTGWAVELARLWNKPVFVYDQEQRRWLSWQNTGWMTVPTPTIHHRRFCGTGTRSLTEDGRQAIRRLFEQSFGPRPASR